MIKSTKLSLTIAVAVCGLFALPLSGCVDKPGTALNVKEATPVAFQDPSSTHSVAVLGQETTSTAGPLTTETSKLTDDGMWETNSGGAAKQRVQIVVLPDGTVRSGGSAASDLDIGEIETTWTPTLVGDEVVMARALRFRNLRTSNSAVQNSVNQAVALLVSQWQRASDNERAVLEKQLETQAQVGVEVARAALDAIRVLKAAAGVP